MASLPFPPTDNQEEGLFEGCGREGPILGQILCYKNYVKLFAPSF